MEIVISIIGALTAVIVALIGTLLSYRHTNKIEILKLKEEHYISYIQALHNLAANNDNKTCIRDYTYYRDKILIVASENVIKALLSYEENAVGKTNIMHDEYLTNLIKLMRKDLKIKDREFPTIYLKK